MMNHQQPASSPPLPQGTAKPQHGLKESDWLRILARSFKPHIIDFKDFRNLAREQFESGNIPEKLKAHPQYSAFCAIRTITVSEMQRLNQSFPGLPIDSFERTLNLITREGSTTVVLKGLVEQDRVAVERVLGYGVVIKGLKNFTTEPYNEVPHIRSELIQDPNACRVIRLFVTAEGRMHMARGEAFTELMKDIKAVSGQHPLIAMVLTGINPVEGKFNPDQKPDDWLVANGSLIGEGFVHDAGSKFLERFHHPASKQTVDIEFQWAVYLPDSVQGKAAIAAHQARFALANRKTKEQLALIAPGVPLADGEILVWGRRHFAFDIAKLWPGNPVQYAQLPTREAEIVRGEKLPNLKDVSAEVSGSVTEPSSKDSILILGHLPDVAASAPGAPKESIQIFLENQVLQAKVGGALVLRNTTARSGPRQIILELENTPQANKPTITEQFLTFLKSEIKEPHISSEDWLQIVKLDEQGSRSRFLVPSLVAQEFALKYFYPNLNRERLRPFTLQTPEAQLEMFKGKDVRVLFDGPEHSEWLHQNHHHGKIRMIALGGAELPPLPTNQVTYLQRVAPGEGVEIKRVRETMTSKSDFVKTETWQGTVPETGEIITREVVDRKNQTLTVHAVAISDEGRFLIQRRIYPRPIIANTRFLDQSLVGGYLAEPVAAIVPDESLVSVANRGIATAEILKQRAGIDSTLIKHLDAPTTYFPQADAIKERVVAQIVELSSAPSTKFVDTSISGLSTKVKVEMSDGLQLIERCQRGLDLDNRSEMIVYQELLKRGISLGEWVAPKISPAAQDCPMLSPTHPRAIVLAPLRAIFSRVSDATLPERFRETWQGEYVEVDSSGGEVGRCVLEYMSPGEKSRYSSNYLPLLPIVLATRGSGRTELLVGIEMRDLPAAQAHTGSSLVASQPTFLAEKQINSIQQAQRFASDQLNTHFGIKSRNILQLGGKSLASPGVTDSVNYPMIVEVDAENSRFDTLKWVPLREMLKLAPQILDGQLRSSIYRASHMLGVI